jgi:hypothetical protein
VPKPLTRTGAGVAAGVVAASLPSHAANTHSNKLKMSNVVVALDSSVLVRHTIGFVFMSFPALFIEILPYSAISPHILCGDQYGVNILNFAS